MPPRSKTHAAPPSSKSTKQTAPVAQEKPKRGAKASAPVVQEKPVRQAPQRRPTAQIYRDVPLNVIERFTKMHGVLDRLPGEAANQAAAKVVELNAELTQLADLLNQVDFDAKVSELQIGDLVFLTEKDKVRYSNDDTGFGEEAAKGTFRIDALTDTSARLTSTIDDSCSLPGISRRGLKRAPKHAPDESDS
jgi:hypothetical protein